MTRLRLFWVFALQALAGLCAVELAARAGGGDSFSGGGGSGGGGGGGGGDAGAIIYLIIKLIELLFYLWTQGGVPGKIACVVILAGLAVAGYFWMKSKNAQKAREIEGRVYRSSAAPRFDNSAAKGLAELRRADPNFSRVLFLDFAHLVFTKLQESRGLKESGAVAPYLAPELREKLRQQPVSVSNVVVGALNIVSVSAEGDKQRIAVRFKANVVETSGGSATRKLIEQRMVFVRPRGILTASPERTLALGCPQCGSPEEPRQDGKCPSCGSVTARGQMQWQVKQIDTLRYHSVLEPLVSSGGMEEGTGAPTVVAPDLQPALRELKMRDQAFTLEGLTTRARHMFMEIQQGWSEVDEKRLRPYETDTLFDAHRYWLTRFKEEGKRNVLEEVKIERMQLAKIEHDAFFDAATLRIYASMKDWYKDKTGKVIGGDPSRTRRFSEYWTLVRRVEAAGKASGDPSKCPSCGAPLDKINMAGVCEYCGGKVISGAFDWVLAIITQDEEYMG